MFPEPGRHIKSKACCAAERSWEKTHVLRVCVCVFCTKPHVAHKNSNIKLLGVFKTASWDGPWAEQMAGSERAERKSRDKDDIFHSKKEQQAAWWRVIQGIAFAFNKHIFYTGSNRVSACISLFPHRGSL